MAHDKLIVVKSKLNRFYLGTVIAGAICFGLEYGWLVGLGTGLFAFSVLGGMDELLFKVQELNLVTRSWSEDVYEKLVLIDEKLALLLDDDPADSDDE